MSALQSQDRVVIVGGGVAALSAAERLRERGWQGELTIVADEPHAPYSRPALSKDFLARSKEASALTLPVFHTLDAIWRRTEAVALDTETKTVSLGDGETLSYDALVIASGSDSKPLSTAPHSHRIHTIRKLEDAARLRTALDHGKHVVIVGGGFIGCEMASVARDRAQSATIVGLSPHLLSRPLGSKIGAEVADLHRRHGVGLELGTAVAQWEETARSLHLTLENGRTLPADVVVVGVGSIPRTRWLAGSGVDVEDGVLCTETGQVLSSTGVPLEKVVAAGDVARWPNIRFDHAPRRIEHWINAIEMGQAVAETLIAGEEQAEPFTPVPRFWSYQHGVRIQSVGFPFLGHRMEILEGSLRRRRFVAGYFEPTPSGQDMLTGAVAFDAPRALSHYRAVIGRSLMNIPA